MVVSRRGGDSSRRTRLGAGGRQAEARRRRVAPPRPGTSGRRRHRRTRAWPGVSVTFVIEAQVQSSVGTITNTATLASSTFDPVAANNTNAATLVMQGGTGRKPR